MMTAAGRCVRALLAPRAPRDIGRVATYAAVVVGAAHRVALVGEGQRDGQRGRQAHQEQGSLHLADRAVRTERKKTTIRFRQSSAMSRSIFFCFFSALVFAVRFSAGLRESRRVCVPGRTQRRSQPAPPSFVYIVSRPASHPAPWPVARHTYALRAARRGFNHRPRRGASPPSTRSLPEPRPRARDSHSERHVHRAGQGAVGLSTSNRAEP